MMRTVPGPACWVVEGCWRKPEYAMQALAGQPIPDEGREWRSMRATRGRKPYGKPCMRPS
jgi:hypothetical protein